MQVRFTSINTAPHFSSRRSRWDVLAAMSDSTGPRNLMEATSSATTVPPAKTTGPTPQPSKPNATLTVPSIKPIETGSATNEDAVAGVLQQISSFVLPKGPAMRLEQNDKSHASSQGSLEPFFVSVVNPAQRAGALSRLGQLATANKISIQPHQLNGAKIANAYGVMDNDEPPNLILLITA